jgi:hypothetical protein
VVANPQAGIERLEDIKGRRINLGPAGSGIRAVAEALIGALGWRARDFKTLAELGVDAQVEALCNGRIDAFVLPVSHPNGAVAETTGSCGAILVEVAGSAIERLIGAWPFYAPARIPAGTYRGNAEAVRTYGTRATLVTTAGLPEDVVYEFVKSVFGKLDQLPAQHAALAGLDAAQMLGAINTAAFHAGALRYYRERGWKYPLSWTYPQMLTTKFGEMPRYGVAIAGGKMFNWGQQTRSRQAPKAAKGRRARETVIFVDRGAWARAPTLLFGG